MMKKNQSRFVKFLKSPMFKKVFMVSVFAFISGLCFSQVTDGDFKEIENGINAIVGVVKTIMGVVTGLLAMVGTISCGVAAWNNKQDLGEHIKKWVIGVAIAGLATTVMSIVQKNIQKKGTASFNQELVVKDTHIA